MNEKLSKITIAIYRRYGNFNFSLLIGPHNAKFRQEIMEIAIGQKLPQSKCGITALMKELMEIAGIEKLQYDCIRNREIRLEEKMRQVLEFHKLEIRTNHFESFAGAARYYSYQDIDEIAVRQKIKDREIVIGMPPIKDGYRIELIPGEWRYRYVSTIN